MLQFETTELNGSLICKTINKFPRQLNIIIYDSVRARAQLRVERPTKPKQRLFQHHGEISTFQLVN